MIQININILYIIFNLMISQLPQDANNQLRMSSSFRKLAKIKINIKKSLSNPLNIIPQQKSQLSQFSNKSTIKKKCKLCYQYKSNFQAYMSCNHKIFCAQCSSQFIEMKILDRQTVILCQMKDCPGKFNQKSRVYEELDQKIKNIYLRTNLIINQKFINCKTPDCQGLFNQQKLICQRCKAKYCKKCLEFDHQSYCRTQLFINQENIKQCPKCKILIQKNEGCNHMICPCKHQFCFVCLQNWNKAHHLCKVSNQTRGFFRSFFKSFKKFFTFQ